MSPYLWTWLARWAGMMVLTVLWTVFGCRALAARRVDAVIWLGMAATAAWALSTHLLPLLTGGLVPAEPTALEVLDTVPFVGFGLLAVRGPARVDTPGFDLWSLVPAALYTHGWPAGWLAIVLIGRGHVLPGGPRRERLLVGLIMVVAGTVLAAHHSLAESWVPLGLDGSVRAVAAAVAMTELIGWSCVAWGCGALRPSALH